MPGVVVTGRVFFESARATEAFRTHLGVGRAEAESLTDALRAGREVRVHAETAEAQARSRSRCAMWARTPSRWRSDGEGSIARRNRIRKRGS